LTREEAKNAGTLVGYSSGLEGGRGFREQGILQQGEFPEGDFELKEKSMKMK